MRLFIVEVGARNLIQARRRTFLLFLALMAVTTLLMLLLSLSGGLTETMLRSATTLASGHVNVGGFYKAKSSDASPIVTEKSKLREVLKELVPEAIDMRDRAKGWSRIISASSSLNTGMVGILIEQEKQFLERVQLAPQSLYKKDGSDKILGDLTQLKDKGKMMLFAGQAKRLEVDVGDPISVTVETLSGERNTAEFTVAAIAKDIGFMSNWNVFAHLDSIQDLYQLKPNVTGGFQIFLPKVEDSAAVMGRLQKDLTSRGYEIMEHDPRPFFMKFESVAGEDWLGQKLDLTIWSDEISFLDWVLTAVNSVSFLLVSILVVIITVGIMNSMWISVKERTGEIGTLRAMGMQKSEVLFLFMTEAFVLGFAATIVGALFGAFLVQLIDSAKVHIPFDAVQAILMSDTLHLSLSFRAAVWSVFAFSMIASLAALWPAWVASRMRPVTAMHA